MKLWKTTQLYKTMLNYEKLFETKKNYIKLWKLYKTMKLGNQWTNQWTSMKINEHQCKSMKINWIKVYKSLSVSQRYKMLDKVLEEGAVEPKPFKFICIHSNSFKSFAWYVDYLLNP